MSNATPEPEAPRFSRRETEGIVERTLANFHTIETAYNEGYPHAYVVTQLVCSLLGLVVFPWEQMVKDRAEKTPLADLKKAGWPEWEYLEGDAEPETLDRLLWNLRNGVAHAHIWFSSDSRDLSDLVLEVTNFRVRQNKPKVVAWKGRIKGEELKEFCERLGSYIINVVG